MRYATIQKAACNTPPLALIINIYSFFHFSMTYAVVAFTGEDDDLAIVSTRWLINDKDCYWPPYRTTFRIDKAVREAEVPGSEWHIHAIRVLTTTGKKQYLFFFFFISISLRPAFFYIISNYEHNMKLGSQRAIFFLILTTFRRLWWTMETCTYFACVVPIIVLALDVEMSMTCYQVYLYMYTQL